MFHKTHGNSNTTFQACTIPEDTCCIQNIDIHCTLNICPYKKDIGYNHSSNSSSVYTFYKCGHLNTPHIRRHVKDTIQQDTWLVFVQRIVLPNWRHIPCCWERWHGCCHIWHIEIRIYHKNIANRRGSHILSFNNVKWDQDKTRLRIVHITTHLNNDYNS